MTALASNHQKMHPIAAVVLSLVVSRDQTQLASSHAHAQKPGKWKDAKAEKAPASLSQAGL